MSGVSNSQPLKSVSLKFGQKDFDSAETAPIRPADSARRSSGQDGGHLTGSQASRTSLQVLTEAIEFAHQERISDLQFQAGRFIYANGGGSTRPCQQWGKLSGDTLREILELFYAQRTIFKGFESEDGHKGNLLHLLIADRKLDFACEGKEADGALGVGRFRVQAHFSHQGIGITVRLVSNGITPFEKIGLPANVVESVCQKVTKK